MDDRFAIHEEAHRVFWTTLDDAHRLKAQAICDEYGGGDFDEGYLGFLGTYLLLSQLIPKDRVVYDIGCAQAFQAWFFRDHQLYVGIDPCPVRFRTPNGAHVVMTVEDWAAQHRPEHPHFAIHNYAPGGREAVKATFQDCYTFYPQGDFGGMLRKLRGDVG